MNFLKAFAVIAVVLVAIAGLSLATGVWRYVTAPFWGKVNAEVQLESAPSRISFYNQFFDLCAGVQAIEGQIDAQRSLDTEQSRINVAGLEGRRAQIIAKYNQNANKDYTAARFHDADLPFQLSSKPYDGTNKTQCSL